MEHMQALKEKLPAKWVQTWQDMMQDRKRAIRLAAIALSIAVLAAAAFTLWEATKIKRVTLVVGGIEQQFETKQESVHDFLLERSVAVGGHDIVSMPLNATLLDGDQISVQFTKPVIVRADGEQQVRYTAAGTVGEAIQELGLNIGAEDKVQPALNAKIASGSTIRIVRVTTVVEDYKEKIPFATVTKNDTSLLRGKQKIVSEGKEGLLVKQIKKVIEDGVVVSETIVDETVAAPSVNKVVAVGTKKAVVALSSSSPSVEQMSFNGITFGAKQVLTNVTLTAYDAGPASTGKTKDDPQYGMTYSGTRATEGRTISVDPKVVPMGWWVYIEGIGFRRAEDIGGAVKGKKIDVYFENASHADRFGTKKGYTVYIIGPKKPAAN